MLWLQKCSKFLAHNQCVISQTNPGKCLGMRKIMAPKGKWRKEMNASSIAPGNPLVVPAGRMRKREKMANFQSWMGQTMLPEFEAQPFRPLIQISQKRNFSTVKDTPFNFQKNIWSIMIRPNLKGRKMAIIPNKLIINPNFCHMPKKHIDGKHLESSLPCILESIGHNRSFGILQIGIKFWNSVS